MPPAQRPPSRTQGPDMLQRNRNEKAAKERLAVQDKARVAAIKQQEKLIQEISSKAASLQSLMGIDEPLGPKSKTASRDVMVPEKNETIRPPRNRRP